MNLLAVGEILLNRVKTDKNIAPCIVKSWHIAIWNFDLWKENWQHDTECEMLLIDDIICLLFLKASRPACHLFTDQIRRWVNAVVKAKDHSCGTNKLLAWVKSAGKPVTWRDKKTTLLKRYCVVDSNQTCTERNKTSVAFSSRINRF